MILQVRVVQCFDLIPYNNTTEHVSESASLPACFVDVLAMHLVIVFASPISAPSTVFCFRCPTIPLPPPQRIHYSLVKSIVVE